MMLAIDPTGMDIVIHADSMAFDRLSVVNNLTIPIPGCLVLDSPIVNVSVKHVGQLSTKQINRHISAARYYSTWTQLVNGEVWPPSGPAHFPIREHVHEFCRCKGLFAVDLIIHMDDV